MAVDIFQVEDDRDIQFLTQMRAKITGLSYSCAANYEEMKEKITQAKVYLVDCNFPKDKGSKPELLAQNVIEIIRANNYLGKIVLFSNDYKSKDIAEINQVSSIEKSDIASLDNLLKEVKSGNQ